MNVIFLNINSNNNKNSIFNRISVKLKRKYAKPKYRKSWPDQTIDWYTKIHNENFLIHKHFKNYLKSKTDIHSVLEIGCGMDMNDIIIIKFQSIKPKNYYQKKAHLKINIQYFLRKVVKKMKMLIYKL